MVFFDDRYHEVYGAQENLLLLAELSDGNDVRCRVVTSAEGELSAAARRRGIDVGLIEAPPQLRTFEKGTIRGGVANRYRSLRAWTSYSAKVDRAFGGPERPDAVVAGSVRSAVHLGRLALRPRGPKILLFAQNSTPFGVFAVLAALISDRILLIAPGAAATFPKLVLGILRRRVRDLPSGRDLERYRVATDRRPPAATVSVVAVGSVTRRKGLDVLVEAMGAVVAAGRSCRLVVVGGTSGQDSEQFHTELVTLARELDVDLELVGWQDDVLPYLDRADIFALASYDEGLPGVLLEAMAASLPCVTTEAGGSGDLVRAAGCGTSVPIGDAEAFAAALMRLIDDPETRIRQGQLGREHVERHHSLDAYRTRFRTILDEVAPA